MPTKQFSQLSPPSMLVDTMLTSPSQTRCGRKFGKISPPPSRPPNKHNRRSKACASFIPITLNRTLAKFVSLSLFLGPPPTFTPKAKEGDVAPDAAPLLPFAPLLQTFYANAGLHAIWEKHRQEYAALVEQYHDAVAKMLFDTGIYLKIPQSGSPG